MNLYVDTGCCSVDLFFTAQAVHVNYIFVFVLPSFFREYLHFFLLSGRACKSWTRNCADSEATIPTCLCRGRRGVKRQTRGSFGSVFWCVFFSKREKNRRQLQL